MDYKIGDEVYFQAYEDNTPVIGKINRIGTLKELNKHQLDKTDTRIFYELVTIGDDPTVFTVTTGKWIYKKNKFTAKDVVTKKDRNRRWFHLRNYYSFYRNKSFIRGEI